MAGLPLPVDTGSPLEVARRHRLRREGRLPFDLHLFISLLREVGIPVPAAGTLVAVRALDAVSLSSVADVHAALASALVADAEEGALFDLVFPTFWSAAAPSLLTPPEESSGADPLPGDDNAGGLAAVRLGSRRQRRGDEEGRRASYSSSGRRSGSVSTAGAEEDMIRLARRLVRALARSRGRRMRSGDVGDVIDVRDSLRRNLGSGGELLSLRRMREVTDRARLAVLCDVSSSMAPYAELFLGFTHALTRVTPAIETAIFNVETCSVTDVFRRRALPDALAWLTDRSVALAGGTRIGHCLHDFNRLLVHRGLTGPQVTALILSDGWDVGEPDLLEVQAGRLAEQVGQVIWLDPHAAATGFCPQVRGLRIALPHVDAYLDFSTPAALEDLVATVERRTPAG